MTTVNGNQVALGIESFGDDDAPLVLLAGGTTMLSWPDALCERLAADGRRVVRYDLRDNGESTTADPGEPAYNPARPRCRRGGTCRRARRGPCAPLLFPAAAGSSAAAWRNGQRMAVEGDCVCAARLSGWLHSVGARCWERE